MDAPGNDLAPAALAIARVEYPSLDPQPYLATLDRMGEEAHARIGATSDLPQEETRPGVQRIPVRRAGLRREPRALRRSAQQLPQRGARSPHRHPDQPRRHLPRGGAPRRPAGGRRELPGALPAAAPDGEHGRARLGVRDHRPVSRRRAAVRIRLPAAAAAARRRRSGVRHDAAAPATRHDIVVRMLVNLKRLYVRMRSFPAGAVHLDAAARGRPVRDLRAARPRPARLSPPGLRRRPARSRGVSAARAETRPNTASTDMLAEQAMATMRTAATIPTTKKRATTRRRSGST